MTMMDNHEGLTAFTGMEGENISVQLDHNKFYGETDIPDCPHNSDDYCWKVTKTAIMPPNSAVKGK